MNLFKSIENKGFLIKLLFNAVAKQAQQKMFFAYAYGITLENTEHFITRVQVGIFNILSDFVSLVFSLIKTRNALWEDITQGKR